MNNNQRKTDRNVDIVFCIDGTGSMRDCIDTLKDNALKFQSDLSTYLQNNNTNITSLRVKLITFRDYGCDVNAMVETDFFELPLDDSDFKKALSEIIAIGGGDEPENGLEAIYYAMKSDFYTNPKDRQIIVLFTDTDALPLLERQDTVNYPRDMADEFEFQNMWACSGRNAQTSKLRNKLKRLVMFAPVNTKYQQLSEIFEQTYFQQTEAGGGLKEINFDQIIKLIAASIGA